MMKKWQVSCFAYGLSGVLVPVPLTFRNAPLPHRLPSKARPLFMFFLERDALARIEETVDFL
jgi:hypothetical protein